MALCVCLCDGVGYRYILLTKICMTTIHYNATMKMTKKHKKSFAVCVVASGYVEIHNQIVLGCCYGFECIQSNRLYGAKNQMRKVMRYSV